MSNIQSVTHPNYSPSDWTKYRYAFNGGSEFVKKYLEKFSVRESQTQFNNRLLVSYPPTHAKAAVNEIINAIYQRMNDITRVGGPDSYQSASQGADGGVDLNGMSMNGFMGTSVLPELAPIGKVGIYVDAPVRDELNDDTHPYIYTYRAEDIRSWKFQNGQLSAVLLRNKSFISDNAFGLPEKQVNQYRLLSLSAGGVLVQFFDHAGEPTGSTTLELSKIPFHILELNQSLMADIADIQIALLQLASSDMNYSLKSNFPFYTEQYDPMEYGNLRDGIDTSIQSLDSTPDPDGTEEKAEEANDPEAALGTGDGRRYPKGLDQPGFIHPSSEPLVVSMQKQAVLQEDIRKLINLNISATQSRRASAESKQEDGRGKEEGLSSIGLELEYAERFIADIWAQYERSEPATVKYPTNYSLKTEGERRQEANDILAEAVKIPSRTYQKNAAKRAVLLNLGHVVSIETTKDIFDEIDDATLPIVDPETIRKDHEEGYVSDEVAAALRLYPKSDYLKAREDKATKTAMILEAQQEVGGDRKVDKEKAKLEGNPAPVRGDGK